MTSYAKQQIAGFIFLALASAWIFTARAVRFPSSVITWGWTLELATFGIALLFPMLKSRANLILWSLLCGEALAMLIMELRKLTFFTEFPILTISGFCAFFSLDLRKEERKHT